MRKGGATNEKITQKLTRTMSQSHGTDVLVDIHAGSIILESQKGSRCCESYPTSVRRPSPRQGQALHAPEQSVLQRRQATGSCQPSSKHLRYLCAKAKVLQFRNSHLEQCSSIREHSRHARSPTRQPEKRMPKGAANEKIVQQLTRMTPIESAGSAGRHPPRFNHPTRP